MWYKSGTTVIMYFNVVSIVGLGAGNGVGKHVIGVGNGVGKSP